MADSPPTATDALDASIGNFLATLQAQVDAVEVERAQLREQWQQRDDALRQSVSKARRLIAANSKPGPKGKGGKTQAARKEKGWLGIAREKVDGLLAYLKANDVGEFNTTHLLERKDFVKATGIASQQQLNKAVIALHDEGAVRLVRQGGVEGLGNRTRVWKLTGGKNG